jgi:hypothetical protein
VRGGDRDAKLISNLSACLPLTRLAPAVLATLSRNNSGEKVFERGAYAALLTCSRAKPAVEA